MHLVSEKSMPDSKALIIILLVLVLAVGGVSAGLSYFYSQQFFQDQLLEKENAIKDLQRKMAATPTPRKETPPPMQVTTVGAQELDCLQCHELQQHKAFHVPERIMKVDAAHGKRRRVCIDCHGPNGYDEKGQFLGWNADKQMTDLKDIQYDPTVGENGVFILPNKVVHTIHKRKLDAGVVTCQFCHVPPGSLTFVRPQAKTELGRVLYCQNEGCHDSEGGNFIAIHIELRPFKCTSCHTGDIIKIHLPYTSRLGKFVNATHITTH